MKYSVLSVRYAEAFADLVEEAGELENVRRELLLLSTSLGESPAFTTLAMTARLGRREKKACFERLGREIGLSELTGRLISYLIDKKRLPLLAELAHAFADEADRRGNVQRAVLTSAVRLSDEQRELVREKLEQMTGKAIRVEEEVDEGLIAGFQVSLDGRLYDGSLRGQIERMKERLAHGAGALHTT
jgi:F-type H+-transporting ATPase subunit delta